ncbi:hypothetical protein MKW94_004247 [Papaver nudicaule]|uniref:Diacylglycerol O-acyltransferase n=1 Tax=Papaver nudicaule TaxID=74823 RepID=A0AA41S0E5_PAPNU|nr:hypothetical protein [Papaver nudicaule]
MEGKEPVTPLGRLFLQEETNNVINCLMVVKNPINIESIKTEIKNSLLIQHPRFRSVLVRNNNGIEYWKRTQNVNLDDHIFLSHVKYPPNNISSADEIVNEYLADLAVSSPLSVDKPLWEIHVLKDQNALVWRFHHALGDGVSLMSLILAICRKVDQPDQLPTIPKSVKKNKRSFRENIWELVMTILLSFVYAVELLLTCLCSKREAKTSISGGSGVELWPRKLATARFKIEDMKSVKNAVLNATINDVLFGVIAAGLSRYLDYHQPSDSKPLEGLRITGLGMVNLRKQPGIQDMSALVKSKSLSSSWGNKFGFILLPIYYHKNVDDNPIQYVKRAKAMLDKKKLSLEAYFSYANTSLLMSLLGPKASALLTYRVFCNTSFTISNIVGPEEEIMFGGNPLTAFNVTSSSLPHALTMHMLSYAGKAEMQILVAKDIIPDPQFLAKCFEDALLEMKDASTDIIQTQYTS